MTAMQRKTYADAVLDLIDSLDNDFQSITGQVDNSLKELDDPSKDDYEAREKAYIYAKQYADTKLELENIEGYKLKYNTYGFEISLLNASNVNYGAYLYGNPYRTIKDVPGIYNNWFKRYGEYGWSNGDLGNRNKTFKTDKCYPEGNLLTTAGGDDSFEPNLRPWIYYEKEIDTGLLHDLEWYRNSYNIIGQGIPHSYKETYYRTVYDKPPTISINDSKKNYKYTFIGKNIDTYYFSYEASSVYWTGTLKKGSIIPLFTEDESVMTFVKVISCKGYWESVPIRTSSSSSSDSYYYYYRYHFSAEFELIDEAPYYYEQINGTNYKRFYEFYPMKKVAVTSGYRVAFASKIQILIRNVLEAFYRSCQDEPDKSRYLSFLNTYSISLNEGNISTVFNNMGSLENFLRYRSNICRGVWNDYNLARSLENVLNDRMNKTDGSLKRWYEGAAMIDQMERDYYKKISRRGNVFKKLLVQKPAEEFESGNKMVIETTPASYYEYVLGYYPSFNVGDTVYIRDDEHNETMCTIVDKRIIKIQNTADVQYENVQRNDGKTEQVAKLDQNGEPITIYTYKDAIELTFNGNIPTIYDPDTLCIIKEI